MKKKEVIYIGIVLFYVFFSIYSLLVIFSYQCIKEHYYGSCGYDSKGSPSYNNSGQPLCPKVCPHIYPAEQIVNKECNYTQIIIDEAEK